MASKTCLARVWDNGDMTSCDSPTVGGSNNCTRCLRHRIASTEQALKEHLAIATDLASKLSVLTSFLSKE